MNKLWDRLFLEDRCTIGISFFRIFVAITVGAHVIPTLLPLSENYYATAFKTINLNIFDPAVIALVQKSPDALVRLFVGIFYISWFMFLIGLCSQLSCIVMTFSCYYFYALNAFHIGTLSWDILLVTLFLMCLTNYHGDYFSIDALRKKRESILTIKRPFFIQRLLQLQIACTYFYTALYKITADGNWIHDNPIYYLMNNPVSGVVKTFLFKDFFMDKPELCYVVGIAIVFIEFSMMFLLFYPKTRISAIYLGFFFHIVLLLTFDVPAIFFFLFPAQLLLFINPENILDWIKQKRKYHASSPMQAQLIYDGKCQFCLRSIEYLKVLDLFGVLKYVDLHKIDFNDSFYQGLTQQNALSQIHLIEPSGKIYGGFRVFQRLCLQMPMLYPLIVLFYFPGAGVLGPVIYDWVAKNRYLFHRHKICRDNSCLLH